MRQPLLNLERHSADVQIALVVGHQQFAASKSGRDHIVLREAVELEPCDAVVVIQIDDSISRTPVRLPFGAMPCDRDVLVERRVQ
jgi:hypothetical protein